MEPDELYDQATYRPYQFSIYRRKYVSVTRAISLDFLEEIKEGIERIVYLKKEFRLAVLEAKGEIDTKKYNELRHYHQKLYEFKSRIDYDKRTAHVANKNIYNCIRRASKDLDEISISRSPSCDQYYNLDTVEEDIASLSPHLENARNLKNKCEETLSNLNGECVETDLGNILASAYTMEIQFELNLQHFKEHSVNYIDCYRRHIAERNEMIDNAEVELRACVDKYMKKNETTYLM